MAEFKYLLLNRQGYAVGRATMDSAPKGERWYLRINDGDPQKLEKEPSLSLVGSSDAFPVMETRVVSSNGQELIVEPLHPLDASVRRNLRVPTGFSSFVYPLTGNWKGRAAIVAEDLSCGGMAFFCSHDMDNGEQVEVVIPVTTQPLLLNMRILRSTAKENGRLYSAQFLDLLHEQETMIRESVFNLQLKKS